MAEEAGPPSLAWKLNRLFAAVHPAGRGEYSPEEVARSISSKGEGSISPAYIYLLRGGQRDNPTKRHLEALAAFFGVSPAYFFDDEVARKIDAQLELLAAMRDADVRHVALRANGLSTESLHVISRMIEHTRQLEGLGARGDAGGDVLGQDLDVDEPTGEANSRED